MTLRLEDASWQNVPQRYTFCLAIFSVVFNGFDRLSHVGAGRYLGSLLALANRKSCVYEGPRIDDVEDMLPHANCGPCGKPGSRPFAEALDTALSRIAGSREAWIRRNWEMYRHGRWAGHLYDYDIAYPPLVRVKDG